MEFNQDIELIEALAAMYPNSKRNTLRKMLTSGRVTVDGGVVHKAKFIVEKGKQVVSQIERLQQFHLHHQRLRRDIQESKFCSRMST